MDYWTTHSMLTGHSFISGTLTIDAGAGVSPAAFLLLTLRPLGSPHWSVAFARFSPGMLLTNSPVSLGVGWECRALDMEIVRMLELPFLSSQVMRKAVMGETAAAAPRFLLAMQNYFLDFGLAAAQALNVTAWDPGYILPCLA